MADGERQGPILRPETADGAAQVRVMSMTAALGWAFGEEAARLDLDDDAAAGYGYISSTAAILRHEALGCRIDGGGASPCHSDADVIALTLAALPSDLGGKWMAARIAGLARAGQMPDAMVGASVRCVPKDVVVNRHGPRARRTRIGSYVEINRERAVRRAIEICEITYTPTPQQIAAAREAWLEWWTALDWLRRALSEPGRLASISLTGTMPPRAPWARPAKKMLTSVF